MTALPVSNQPVSTEPIAYEGGKPAPRPRRDRWIIPALLLLTVIAGALRFTALDRPVIWGDESATYGRIAGTHRELLDQLADDSFFTPLHYELYWWIAQGMPYWGTTVDKPVEEWKRGPDGRPVLPRVNEIRIVRDFVPTHRLVEGGIEMTPFMMRLVPALAGTLMIPAIYFLCRQLFGPRVSLLTATLACFSAYLLVYSRDAKMYMHFWLMCTLNAGCFLWWLRSRSVRSWLAWVGTGLAMIGLHAPGAVLLGVELLILLTAPRQHWLTFIRVLLAVAWFVGLVVVVIYERLRQRFDLIAWLTPDRYLVWGGRIVRGMRCPPVIFFALGLWIIATPTWRYYNEFNRKSDEVVRADNQFDMDRMGIGWVENYNRGRSLDDLVLYTASSYLMSWEWPRYFVDQPGAKDDDRRYVPEMRYKLLSGATIGLLSLMALGLVPWRRIFSPARARLERITQDGRVWAPFVRRRVLWVGAWLIIPAFAFYAASVNRPAFLLDAVSEVALKEPPNVVWPRLARCPGDQTYYSFYTSNAAWKPWREAWPKSWERFSAGFTKENLATTRLIVIGSCVAVLIGLLVWRRRFVWRTTLRLTIATAVVLIAVGVVTLLPRFADKSVWMPRYVAVLMPAFLIACAVLIARQPAWWVRGLTIGLFIMVNLSQYYGRVFTPTEPPTDRMALEVVQSQPRSMLAGNPEKPTFRAYTNFDREEGVMRRFRMRGPDQYSGPEPAGGTIFTGAGSYYLRIYSKKPAPPIQVRQGSYHQNLRLWRDINPDAIERDMQQSREIERFVVWTGIDVDAADLTDPIGDKLKGAFRRVSDEVIPVFDHWNWMRGGGHVNDTRPRWNVRRREYVRIG